jgi:transcriptional regulator with XRE-family HTH domain
MSTLSRIENDHISPTFDQLSKLSLGLSVDVAATRRRDRVIQSTLLGVKWIFTPPM